MPYCPPCFFRFFFSNLFPDQGASPSTSQWSVLTSTTREGVKGVKPDRGRKDETAITAKSIHNLFVK